MKDFDVIVYHCPCSDGSASAWCALKYKNIEKKSPCAAGAVDKINPDVFLDMNVLFVDLCPDTKSLDIISECAKSIVILDHHESAFNMIKNKYEIIHSDNILNYTTKNITVIFDMKRAGCQIVWDYFFDNFDKTERPWFINYIADRDLWNWELPNSKEINASLFHKDYTCIEKMNELENFNENDIKEITNYGKIVLEIQNKDLQCLYNSAIETTFTQNNYTYNVWLVDAPSNLKSEIGNMLTKKPLKSDKNKMPDFSAIWTYDFKSNNWGISLRGSDIVDLSIISKTYNEKCGGHKNASGFTLHKTDTLHDLFKITDIVK